MANKIMAELIKILSHHDLTELQRKQYEYTMSLSYPPFLYHSKVVKECWPLLEKYFSSTQLFMVDQDNTLLGFMNAIPIYWDRPLDELPEEGWDWLIQKGISDYENNIKPNSLGGLQISVTKNNLGKGYSKLLIAEGKKIKVKMGLKNFIIPIRPTFKYNYPEMAMQDYLNLKKDGQVYDPWIRTHLKNGADIIKVCKKAMRVTGNIEFWQSAIKQKIKDSGHYIIEGALNPISIQVDHNHGEYNEENVWISYG